MNNGDPNMNGTMFSTRIHHDNQATSFGCLLYDCLECQPTITALYQITDRTFSANMVLLIIFCFNCSKG